MAADWRADLTRRYSSSNDWETTRPRLHGIALARRLPADSSAPRTADRLQQQLGRRKFVHRGQAADTSLRPEMPIPAPSHQGRLIHKSWSRDCDCGRCCVSLPIAYFARWCGCPSKACFDQFSLPLFTPDYSDSTMSIVLMCFIAIVMDPFLVGAVTSGTRPSPTGTPGRDRSDRCAVAQVEMAPRLGMAPGLQQQRMPHARLAGELPAPISTPTNRNPYRIVQKPISRIANASNSPLTTEMAIHQIMTLTSARHSPHSLIRASQTHGLFRIRIAA